jgi:DNA repair ATPase RecN
MKLIDLTRKMLKGEELTESEKDFVENYKDESIPKSRLDAEIAKRKQAEQKVSDAEAKIEELTSQIEELNEKDLTAGEKANKETQKKLADMQKNLDTLTKERDEAKAKADEMEFNKSVSDLATAHNFSDSKYLAFMVKQKGEDFDMSDADATKAFMEELKTSSPKLFKVPANPGAGSSPGGGGSSDEAFKAAQKDGDAMGMIANAPEVQE